MENDEQERQNLKRTRTAKACMHCRRRRIKCTGESPCASCIKLGRACVYECGPKKPRISHKGVITTLKAENQRLRADLQGLRMFTGVSASAVSSGMAHNAAAPKAEELPFVDAYFAFEEAGLFPLVGRSRFAAVLSGLRSKKSGRGSNSSVPPLSREDTALYFAMLAIGASLRRQEVPAMSYATRVRTILSQSFDCPSETMVRVALLLSVLHGSMLDVAKEACYLSTALQMLAILGRLTGKPVSPDLVATAGAVCSIADGPLPFTTPKDLECDDPLRSLACLITQVAGPLMHEGVLPHDATTETADYADLVLSCEKAAQSLARVQATGASVPCAYPLLVHGMHALCLFRVGRATAAQAAIHRCVAAFPVGASPGVNSGVWSHPMVAFVLRHVTVIATTMGVRGGDVLSAHVHSVAMAWPRAAVYFRGLQNDLRAFDESLRARVDGSEAGATTTAAAPAPAPAAPYFADLVMSSGSAAAPCGGSPAAASTSAMPSAVPAFSLRGESFGNEFDMFDFDDMDETKFDIAGPSVAQVAAATPSCAGIDASRELFGFVQMVTLALGKPYNTCAKVLRASSASTRVLIGAKGSASPSCSKRSPVHRAQSAPASSPLPTSRCVTPTKPSVDCLALPDPWSSTQLLDEPQMGLDTACNLTAGVKMEPSMPSMDDKVRRSSLTLLCDADHDDLEELLFNLTPDELVSVSLQ